MKPTIDVTNLLNVDEDFDDRPIQRVTTPLGTSPKNLSVTIDEHISTSRASTPRPSQGDRTVTVGVLNKWVNGIKGYHGRFFVLDHAKGILSYYKVHGPEKVDVALELEKANVRVVGEQAQKYAAKCRKEGSHKGSGEVQGEISLRAASHRESLADHKKFYVHSGKKTLQLRAESREDRWQWLEALQSCKTNIQTESARSAEDESSIPAYLENACQDISDLLAAKSVSSEVIDAVVGKTHELHTLTVNYVGIERSKRRMLLDYIRSLEDDKRLLEAEVVVEQRRRNSSMVVEPGDYPFQTIEESPSGSKQDLQELSEPAVDSSEDDPDEPEDADDIDGNCGTDVVGASDDEEFFDAVDGVLLRAGTTNSIEITPERAARLSFSGSDEMPGYSPSPARGANSPQQRLSAAIGFTAAPGNLDKLPLPTRRSKLPVPKEKEKTVSLWGIIKEMVGKDLTRVCLPVFFNEPISALQKSAEELEYCQLLDAAASSTRGSTERLVYAAAYAVASYCSTEGRTKKPFNPLQHETYELECPEQGFRFLAEKVCHHPTILAMYAEGRGWKLTGDCNLKSKFWGRCIEINPLGLQQVEFHDGETVSWQKVSTTINNLIIGNMYVDHYGTMKIRSSEGTMAKLKFKEQNFMERHPHQVKGDILGPKGEKIGTMQGKWDMAMSYTLDGKTTVVWERSQFAEDPTKYHLTSWAITLNEMLEGMDTVIPLTDSRRRPDQKLLELGQYTDANIEKQRLEEKQRSARKKNEAGEKAEPRWFRRKPGTVEGEHVLYEYLGGYWEQREEGHWTNVKDIFGST